MTGAITAIGNTGLVLSISALAWDEVNEILYGVTGGSPDSQLVTIDIGTGLATVIGNVNDGGFNIQDVGGLAFGTDGLLYAGVSQANPDGYDGDILQVDPLTGNALVVGPTVNAGNSVTGLTCYRPYIRIWIDSTPPLVPTLRLIENFDTCLCNDFEVIGQPNLDFEVEAEVGHIVEIIDNVTVADSFVSTGRQVRTVLFETGYHYVTARTRDAAGHIGAQTGPIDFFVDVTPPALVCPSDDTVECSDPTGTNVMGVATATDECTNDIVIGWSDSVEPGSCGGESVITRTWTATDACGNATNCDQIITVEDTTPPVVTCTNDVILLGDTHCVAVLPDVTGYVTTFDACNDVIVTQDPLPGTNMPGPGEYFVTMTGFDGCNQSQCLLKVIVRCRTANDYDGDGVADLAVYEETTGDWYIYSVARNDVILAGGNWGWSATRPVAGDYDGDQVSDLSVFDAASGDWWAAAVTTNGLGSILLWYDNWGFPGCVAVPGDYDGDRVFDQAVYHEPSGNWWIKTVDGTILVWQLPWGSPGFSAVSGEE